MFGKIVAYSKSRWEEILMLLGIPLLALSLAEPEVTFALIARTILFLLATALILFHAYTFNDWANYKFDLSDENKKGQALPSRLISLNETLALSIFTLLLGIGIYLLPFFPRVTLGICLLILLLWILYSNQLTLLKSVPVVSTILHLVAGTLFFLLGWSLVRRPAWDSILAGIFFGLLYASGHLSHETIDYEGDKTAGLKTNAVVFGRATTFWGSFIGITASTVYICVLAALKVVYAPAAAWVMIAAYALYVIFFVACRREGFGHASLDRFRSRYRKLYSLAGLIVCLLALV